jgi:signal transduction histidine kinase
MKKLKTKILLGLVFLLLVIFLLSITGIISIYYLSQDSKSILKDNYASVGYTTEMLKSIKDIYINQITFYETKNRSENVLSNHLNNIELSRTIFEKNFELQKKNITEPNEDKIVAKTEESYKQFLLLEHELNYSNDLSNEELNKFKSAYFGLESSIEEIYKINMSAIYKKNNIANNTADKVSLYMAIAAVSSILLTVIFIFYFPSFITSPLKILTEKIEEISNKKYDQRLEIKSDDEFSSLAIAFNKMAMRLKEYEAQHFDELLLEKRKMETLLANLQDGTLLLDNDFSVLHANNKFCELTDLRLTELLGQKLSQIENKNEIISEIIQIDLINHHSINTEKLKPIKLIVKGQAEYFQIIVLDVRKESGSKIKYEPSGYIILIRNITKYQERDLAKTNLIATISHELKTPLSSINISTKLLEDDRIGKLNPEQKELIESIKLQSNRILILVNEVLDFAQANTGQINLSIKPCEVKEIIELGTFAVLMFINEKEIDLDISIPEKTPRVKCDLEKTVWVMVNLLSNAVRYSSQRGKIYIQVKVSNHEVIISVKDEGPGISEEEQKSIFDKYVKSVSGKTKGTGLGLAIAKEFVEVQGGSINVESESGKGSHFYFTLPTV